MSAETPDVIGNIGLAKRTGRSAWWGRLARQDLRERIAGGLSFRFRTISGRILVLNLASFMILLGGMLYLNDFRDQLIQARVQSLGIEARVVASALALESERPETPDVILGQRDSAFTMERATFLLNTLIRPDRNNKKTTEAYVYDRDGTWVADTKRSLESGKLTQTKVSTEQREIGWRYRLWLLFEDLMRRSNLPDYEPPSFKNGREQFPEVNAAIESGVDIPIARENQFGEAVLTVAQPIKKGDVVIGAVLLISTDGYLDSILAQTRVQKLALGLLLLVVTVGASFVLALTIAGPMRRLGQAAKNVRQNINEREDIPDFSHRRDEIGDLSLSLRDMTSALYGRLDAIENFAADVAHELKNPLASIHSAIQTLPKVQREEDREELMRVLHHDVDRLNRLITDISDASRLDVEMVKDKWAYFNIVDLIETHVANYNSLARKSAVKVEMSVADVSRQTAPGRRERMFVHAHKGRITQVLTNLLDNAVSFSPDDGKVLVKCVLNRARKQVKIIVEDDGPGIPPENLNKIFNRFYTDRPGLDQFGRNSGLGLNISRQIITAHGGTIRAENRIDPACKMDRKGKVGPGILGARFIIRLPANFRAV
jgi:two-component system sensor histidine kinase ChvG